MSKKYIVWHEVVRRTMRYRVTRSAVLRSLSQWKSNKYYTFECVFVALGNQQAVRIRHMLHSPVAFMAAQYFPTLSPKGTIFVKKKYIEYKTCVLNFSTTFA
jgi:hypothetical protein